MKKVNKTVKPEHKSLHVLFTGLVSPTMLSGGDQLFLDIAPRLPKELKIIVVTPYFAKDHWKDIDCTNIEFRYLGRNIFELKDNALLTFLSYVVRSWQTHRILRKEKIQSIYSCSDVAYADIWPAYLAVGRNPDVKWLSRIYHVLLPPKRRHGNYLTNVVAFRLQRLSFWMLKKRSSTIFALNPKLYDELLKLGFKKPRLTVLGAGIDLHKISSFKSNTNYEYDVVALGRIAPVKGIFDGVKMWNEVHKKKPELKLAWIGGGQEKYVNKLRSQLEEHSLADSFHLLGFAEKEEVYSILKSSKIFVCLDHEIGWGLAVCEAMASGLPVVSYDNEIFGSVYKKGYKSVPLFDTGSFANEVIELLSNDQSRKKLAGDALRQAEEFDHQQVIDKLTRYL